MSEEINHIHGSAIPGDGEKVSFTNLGKNQFVVGDGVHSCYQLCGHPKA